MLQVNTVSRTLLERLATMIVSIPRSFAKLCNALSVVASERFPDDKYDKNSAHEAIMLGSGGSDDALAAATL